MQPKGNLRPALILVIQQDQAFRPGAETLNNFNIY